MVDMILSSISFLRHSELHKQMAQMPMAHFPIILLPLNLHLKPHGELLKEEKIGPDLQMIMHYLKVYGYNTTVPLSGKAKSTQWSELQEMWGTR